MGPLARQLGLYGLECCNQEQPFVRNIIAGRLVCAT